MRVLFIASEAAPFAKSGGLGDVMGALPGALCNGGTEASVMIPLYADIKEKHFKEMQLLGEFRTKVSWREKYTGLYRLQKNGVNHYFIDNEEYFGREKYYGYFDDGERFAYFCKAALDALPLLDDMPDVLHLSEWQTALVPVYLKTLYADQPMFSSLRTVFTIHNIEYQGQFDLGILEDVFGIGWDKRSLMEWGGGLNLLKGAIVTCDRLTTVSPMYAKELQYAFYAKGLEKIIKENEYKLSGILNGIDEAYFSPENDSDIAACYSKDSTKGKKQNKTALQKELGLTGSRETIMIGMITRLVSHKGIDLVIRAFHEMMQEKVQFVMLASGDPPYEHFFTEMEETYPGRVYFYKGFSESLARKIYAGADLFLMPSVSEPCGLAQMIACKHGTIPIVRETGGLADSIEAYNPETGQGNGVTFRQINASDMLDAVKRACALYRDKNHRKKMMNNCFASDFSWGKGAAAYVKIYKELEKDNR